MEGLEIFNPFFSVLFLVPRISFPIIYENLGFLKILLSILYFPQGQPAISTSCAQKLHCAKGGVCILY